jgi:hypothetical protein
MEHTIKEYVIDDILKVLGNECMGKVKNSPRYKMGTKYIHFSIDISGKVEIINELVANKIETFGNGIVKLNCGFGEQKIELLYDSSKRSFILFPFNSICESNIEGYAKGIKTFKKDIENIDIIIVINKEGKILSQAYCPYDCKYYDILEDGSNIDEIIDLINKSAKKDGIIEKM